MWTQQEQADSCLVLCPASLAATVKNLIYTKDLLGFKPLSMYTDLRCMTRVMKPFVPIQVSDRFVRKNTRSLNQRVHFLGGVRDTEIRGGWRRNINSRKFSVVVRSSY